MRCVGCGAFGMGGGRCRSCGAIVPLPDEELILRAGLGREFVLDEPSPLADTAAGSEPVGSGEPGNGLEPVFSSAVRLVASRIQRPRDVVAELRKEAAREEAEGNHREALELLGRSLLMSPLDPSPIRDLERLAAAHGLRHRLAGIYEELVVEKGHPSGPALLRRVAQLRAAAEEEGVDAAIPSADSAESSVSPQTGLEQPTPVRLGDSAESFASPRMGREQGTADEWRMSAERSADSAESSSLPEGAGRALIRQMTSTAIAGGRALFSPRASRRAPLPEPEAVSEKATWAFRRSRDEADRAPLLARLTAFGVDGALLVALPLLILGLGLRGSFPQGLGFFDQLVHLAARHGSVPIAALGLGTALAFVYFTLSWALGGRTIGEKVAGIRAVEEGSGIHPRPGRAALRSAVAIFGTVAFLAGPLWALFDPEGQTLHDRITGTRTVRG